MTNPMLFGQRRQHPGWTSVSLQFGIELGDAVCRIQFDYEHRFAEHEHDSGHGSRIVHACLELLELFELTVVAWLLR